MMAVLRAEHMLRMEKVIAWLRVAVVLLVTVAALEAGPYTSNEGLLLGIATAAVIYAVGVILAEPSRRLPLLAWHVTSGFLDWLLITGWIVATGGVKSEFYLLYFLSLLSVAMRYGLREVVLAGAGTVLGYFAVVLYSADPLMAGIADGVLRMGYLMLFAVGSGILAREANRHIRARINEGARRLAVQEVTATVCHDLSNPVAAVAGLVKILLESAPDNLSLDQRALLHRIDANTQQMKHLVSNLLDAELIERGRQSFRPELTDVNALVRRVVETQAHQAEAKAIGLVLDLSEQLPPARVDSRMIERLLANLLANAVKFTPEDGAIRVSTRLHGARITLEVWDNGPDVPAAVAAMMFGKFARQHDSPGLGLGLYICKNVVDVHAGSIAVRKVGGGVAFFAELPIVPPPAGEARRPQTVRGPRKGLATWRPQRRLRAFTG
jgi:signal transduction histidine kinase